MQATPSTNYQEAYETLQPKYEAILQELAVLKRMVFGSKSERFIPTDDNKINPQLSLELDAETIAQCRITDATTFTVTRTKTEVIRNAPKAHPGRMKLPEHLRREITILQPDTDVTGLKKIGEEVSEVLDYIPGELFVKQYIRPKYVVPVNNTESTVI
ncbi:MAG: IS66 family transposase, partial [Bacteroidia bacterium]